MKALLLGLMLSVFAASAQANVVTVQQINAQQFATTMMTVDALSLINWKVGDSSDYKVSMGFGLEGTLHKEATKEEGNAIWVKSQINLPIMNDTQEMLMDRNSGKVLKFLHNGKEEQIPDEKIEIISTKNDTVTVPAGTFKCIHITAKTDKIPTIELWAAPRDISLDGAAKTYMDQGMMKITMELTKFVRN